MCSPHVCLHVFVRENMNHLPFGFLWNDKNKKLWSKTQCLVNELVGKRCFDSKGRIKPHDLLAKQHK